MDIGVIDKLKMAGVSYDLKSKELKDILNYLEKNGYEGILPKSYDDLKKAVEGVDAINSHIETNMQQDIAEVFGQAKMINPILMKEWVEKMEAKYKNELQTKEIREHFKALVKEYVEKLGTYKEMEALKDELARDILKEKPEGVEKEESVKNIKKMVDAKILGFDLEENEKLIETNLIKEKVEEIKNLIEQKLLDDKTVLNESKKSIVNRIEDIVNEKLSEEQKNEIDKMLETKDIKGIENVVKVETSEQLGIINEEVDKYYGIKESKKEETIGILKQELDNRGIGEKDREIFQKIVLKNLENITLSDAEKNIERNISLIINNHTHNILYHIIDDEFRRNINVLNNPNVNYKEVVFNLLLLRHDVKNNPQLYSLLSVNRARILEMISLQAKIISTSIEGNNNIQQDSIKQQVKNDTALYESERKRKEIEIKIKQKLKTNKKLIELYKREKMIDVLSVSMARKAREVRKLALSSEQKVAIKKYVDFVVDSIFSQKKNTNLKQWANQYYELKKPNMGYIPYSFSEIRKVDKVASNLYQNFKDETGFALRQYIYKVFGRQQSNGLGNYIETFWTNIKNKTNYNPRSLGDMFMQGGSGRTISSGGGIGNVTENLNNNVNTVGNKIGKGLNNALDKMGINPNNAKRSLSDGLGKLGNKTLNGFLKAGEGIMKGSNNLIMMSFGKYIGILVVVILVFFFLYTMFTMNITSSLVPENAYGGQLTADDPSSDENNDGGGSGFSPSLNCDANNKCPCGWPIRKGHVGQGFLGNCSHARGVANNPNGYYPPIDIDGEVGTPVYATHDGMAECLGSLGYDTGYYIQICGSGCEMNGGGKYCTQYMHLLSQRPDNVCGKIVTRGQLIGYLGCTGSATKNGVCDAHVHYNFIYLGWDYDELNKLLPVPVPKYCCNNCGIEIDASQEPTATPKPTMPPIKEGEMQAI